VASDSWSFEEKSSVFKPFVVPNVSLKRRHAAYECHGFESIVKKKIRLEQEMCTVGLSRIEGETVVKSEFSNETGVVDLEIYGEPIKGWGWWRYQRYGKAWLSSWLAPRRAFSTRHIYS